MLHHLARLTHVRTVLSHDLVAPLRRVQPHGARAAEALPRELQDAVVGRALRRVGGQLRDLGAHFEHGLGGARLLILLGLGDALRLAQLHVQRHGMLGEGGDGRRGVGRRLRDGAHLLARRLRREEVRDVGGGASPAAAGAAAAAALLLLLLLLFCCCCRFLAADAASILLALFILSKRLFLSAPQFRSPSPMLCYWTLTFGLVLWRSPGLAAPSNFFLRGIVGSLRCW